MKSSKFDIEDDSKKRKSAATNFPSSSKMTPPAFSLDASNNMNQSDSQKAQPEKASENLAFKAQNQQSSSSSYENESENDHHDDISKTFSTVKAADMYHATTNAHGYFKQTARLTNVSIHGAHALGAPGCLDGMGLKAMIMADSNMVGLQGADRHMVKAMSNVMDEVFETWKHTFMIPNLPWYPGFIMFPGPVAPPMPNIPMSLAQISFNNYMLSNASYIAQRIMQELPNEMHNSVNAETVQSFSTMITSYFDLWFMTQYLTNAVGMGTVPGWHPMFKPIGPVQGRVIPGPGVFS